MLGNHGRSITRAIFTPLTRVLACVGVTSNIVTVVDIVAMVAITAICTPQRWIWQGGVVLAVMMFGDSVDSILARMTAGGARFGAFLDSTLDRPGNEAVLGSLTACAVFRTDDSFVRTWAVIAGTCSIVGAAAVPYARACAESVGAVAKLGITERTDRLIIGMSTAILMSLGLPEWILATGLTWMALTPFIAVYQRIWFAAHNIDEGTP